MEREPLRYCKGDRKIKGHLTIPLMNLQRFDKHDISDTFTKHLMRSKGLVSCGAHYYFQGESLVGLQTELTIYNHVQVTIL